jgi:hypothetical protein
VGPLAVAGSDRHPGYRDRRQRQPEEPGGSQHATMTLTYWAALTLLMLKSDTRTGGIAVRVK